MINLLLSRKKVSLNQYLLDGKYDTWSYLEYLLAFSKGLCHVELEKFLFLLALIPQGYGRGTGGCVNTYITLHFTIQYFTLQYFMHIRFIIHNKNTHNIYPRKLST